MSHQLSSIAKFVAAFITAITAAANNGATTDALGYERATAIFYSAPSGAGTTSDCKLQEGALANASDMADVPSGALTQVTTGGGTKLELLEVDLSRRLRYIRLVHTGAGGSAAGQAVGVIILHRARNTTSISQSVTPVLV